MAPPAFGGQKERSDVGLLPRKRWKYRPAPSKCHPHAPILGCQRAHGRVPRVRRQRYGDAERGGFEAGCRSCPAPHRKASQNRPIPNIRLRSILGRGRCIPPRPIRRTKFAAAGWCDCRKHVLEHFQDGGPPDAIRGTAQRIGASNWLEFGSDRPALAKSRPLPCRCDGSARPALSHADFVENHQAVEIVATPRCARRDAQ
mmetsp:Transcript_24081/g.67840  ORF Transcript_24081/g.67840 Transcript_24081/m.67840 type:complete len:201 (-) Transcript_24081:418-1020(-)